MDAPRGGRVAEGGGAIGVAALLAEPNRFKNKRIAVVISGGNMELLLRG